MKQIRLNWGWLARGCVIAGLAGLVGCDDPPPTPAAPEPPSVLGDEIDLSDDTAEERRWVILGAHAQPAHSRVEVQIKIDDEPYTFHGRLVDQRYELELTDADGERFGIGMETDGETYVASEWTNTDRLEVEHQDLFRGRTRETYTLNGESRTWVLNERGNDDRLIADQFEAFMPVENSLNDNPLGDRLALLVTDPEFVEELDTFDIQMGGVGTGMELRLPLIVRLGCGGASICMQVKCRYGGGILNNWCNICTGVVVACALALMVWG